MLKISFQAEGVRSDSWAQSFSRGKIRACRPVQQPLRHTAPEPARPHVMGLGIGERRDIAAQRPTVLRDILAEFNRRAQRRSRVYPNPPWRVVVVTPAGEALSAAPS
jgi:hypothetical protein